MTKDKAIQAWFGQFLTAYAATSVPHDATFPYLTYDLAVSAWDGGETYMTVNLWYYGTGEEPANAKAAELSRALGIGGATVSCDEGLIWLKRGDPWCQTVREEGNPNIKRRYINMAVEFMTLY